VRAIVEFDAKIRLLVTVWRRYGRPEEIRGFCKAVNLDDVCLHDLRYTFCNRLVEAEVPIAEGARVSGHDQLSTFYRYVNANSDTIRRASEALDNLRKKKTPL
jgi:hypothetical protein